MVLGTIGIQEPKSGYHYGDCALTETTPMTNPVEPWKMGLLTPPYILQPFRAPPILSKISQSGVDVTLLAIGLPASIARLS